MEAAFAKKPDKDEDMDGNDQPSRARSRQQNAAETGGISQNRNPLLHAFGRLKVEERNAAEENAYDPEQGSVRSPALCPVHKKRDLHETEQKSSDHANPCAEDEERHQTAIGRLAHPRQYQPDRKERQEPEYPVQFFGVRRIDEYAGDHHQRVYRHTDGNQPVGSRQVQCKAACRQRVGAPQHRREEDEGVKIRRKSW